MNHLRKVNHIWKRYVSTVAVTTVSEASGKNLFRLYHHTFEVKTVPLVFATLSFLGGIWWFKRDVANDVSALQTDVTKAISALQTDVTNGVSALQTDVTNDVSTRDIQISAVGVKVDGAKAELRYDIACLKMDLADMNRDLVSVKKHVMAEVASVKTDVNKLGTTVDAIATKMDAVLEALTTPKKA